MERWFLSSERYGRYVLCSVSIHSGRKSQVQTQSFLLALCISDIPQQLTQCVYIMWYLLLLDFLPFLSLAPLPHHLQQQCKQLSARTFELLSQSSSPSLWRDRQQDVSDANGYTGT